MDLAAWHDKCWADLPSALKWRAVDYLRANLPLEEIAREHTRDPDFWAKNHFFWGMAVRNLLRDVITDDELPPQDYDGVMASNWDDYYQPAVEAALGFRPVVPGFRYAADGSLKTTLVRYKPGLLQRARRYAEDTLDVLGRFLAP